MKSDVERIVWEWLTTSGNSLYSLCGSRVWHSAYPEIDDIGEGAFIVFFAMPTRGNTNSQTDRVSVDFRCHGADRTFTAARDVADALYDRLQAMGGTTNGGRIHRAFHQTSQNLTDPDTGWPFTLARYNLITE